MQTDNGDLISKRKKQAIVLGTVFWVSLGTIVAVSLAILVVNAVVSLQNRSTLYDCTTAGGKCYQNAVDRANTRTELTKDVIVLTAVCAEEPRVRNEADRVTRIRLLEECVNDQLRKENPDGLE